MPVYRLNPKGYGFPPPGRAEPNGLLAVGGDLLPQRLISAYLQGIFPWYTERDKEILWWCPRERFVIFPKEIHVSRSMKKFMAKTDLKVTYNTCFEGVINACRKTRELNEGTWITDDMEKAYIKMFHLGLAESCEVWQGEELVGGLYGILLNRNFFGESMFSKVENASKLALISFAKSREHYEFIDCQMHTDHLESMGGRYISYEEYINLIRKGAIDV